MRRLRWQCRRGLLELDLLFERFLATHYQALTPADQASFRMLLREPDPSLLAWIQGQEPPPENLKNIIRLVVQ